MLDALIDSTGTLLINEDAASEDEVLFFITAATASEPERFFFRTALAVDVEVIDFLTMVAEANVALFVFFRTADVEKLPLPGVMLEARTAAALREEEMVFLMVDAEENELTIVFFRVDDAEYVFPFIVFLTTAPANKLGPASITKRSSKDATIGPLVTEPICAANAA